MAFVVLESSEIILQRYLKIMITCFRMLSTVFRHFRLCKKQIDNSIHLKAALQGNTIKDDAPNLSKRK